MPADYVILEWAQRAANVRMHQLGKWSQSGEIAVAVCELCGRTATADFSADASERDEEVRGTAITEDCDATPLGGADEKLIEVGEMSVVKPRTHRARLP
jgi:hypothetical protein